MIPAQSLVPNPFCPQLPILDPAKFAGRTKLLAAAVRRLFNFGNILVTGERGIGKSSFANQLRNVTLGETTILQRIEIGPPPHDFRCLVSDCACAQDWGLSDVLASLESRLLEQIPLADITLRVRQRWAVDLRVLAYEEETEEIPRFDSRHVDHFLAVVKECIKCCSDISGVCLVIDEVDALATEVHLAPFMKIVMESAQLRCAYPISFVLVGQSGTMARFMEQHPSSQRVFEEFELPRMSDEEVRELLRCTLADTGVKINPLAESAVISLAFGCPEPVQLVGYYAYEAKTNSVIDLQDLRAGVKRAMHTMKRRTLEVLTKAGARALDLAILQTLTNEESGLSLSEVAQRISAAPYSRNASKPRGLVTDSIVAQSLRLLGEHGVVHRFRSKYTVKDPLIRAYILLQSAPDSV